MDHPSSSSLVKEALQSDHQHQPSTFGKTPLQHDIQPTDNTFGQFQLQSSEAFPDSRFEQSHVQANTAYADALEAEITCLQAEMTSHNATIHKLTYENENLKVELEKFRECVQILLKHMEKQQEEEEEEEEVDRKGNELVEKQQEEEEEVDRKGKKKVENNEPREKKKLKKLVICTKKGTCEVRNVLALSDNSDDTDSDNDITIQEEGYDDEEDAAQINEVMNMSRLEGIGSSSKMGSGSVEIGDITQSKSGKDCALSNGGIEKLSVLDENKPLFKAPLISEVASWGEKLYRRNNNEGLKVASSGESGSPTSCQTVLPPDTLNSKSTIGTPEIVKKNENEAKLIHRKRKWDGHWHTEEEMLCALNDEMLLEAVCALFRQEWKMRRSRSKGMMGLSDTDFKRLMQVTSFLTDHDASGPNRKTTEELEKYIKGGSNFCSMLVGTYSPQLFQIYCRGMDDHFC